MKKRIWPSILFLAAFGISLVHSSIPHSHPDPEHAQSTKSHHHEHGQGEHRHKGTHSNDGSDHNADRHLPVFSHFSNAEFLSKPRYEFFAKCKVIIDCIEPIKISLQISWGIDKPVPIPKARELPSSRFQSSISLRAPPFIS